MTEPGRLSEKKIKDKEIKDKEIKDTHFYLLTFILFNEELECGCNNEKQDTHFFNQDIYGRPIFCFDFFTTETQRAQRKDFFRKRKLCVLCASVVKEKGHPFFNQDIYGCTIFFFFQSRYLWASYFLF